MTGSVEGTTELFHTKYSRWKSALFPHLVSFILRLRHGFHWNCSFEPSGLKNLRLWLDWILGWVELTFTVNTEKTYNSRALCGSPGSESLWSSSWTLNRDVAILEQYTNCLIHMCFLTDAIKWMTMALMISMVMTLVHHIKPSLPAVWQINLHRQLSWAIRNHSICAIIEDPLLILCGIWLPEGYSESVRGLWMTSRP